MRPMLPPERPGSRDRLRPVLDGDVHPATQRVLDAAARKGMTLEVRVFPEGTHTAVDAAAAVGAELGQIVKSLVFVAPDEDGALEPIVCLVSGPNRVDVAAPGRDHRRARDPPGDRARGQRPDRVRHRGHPADRP